MADQSITNSDPRSFPNSIGPVAAINMSAGIVCYASSANHANAAIASAAATARVIGVNRHYVAAGDNCNLCYSGPVELTTDDWDSIFGTEGGLSAGTTYYLSAATAGHGTSSVPGSHKVVVGVAINSTTLLVGIQNTAGDS